MRVQQIANLKTTNNKYAAVLQDARQMAQFMEYRAAASAKIAKRNAKLAKAKAAKP